MKDRAIAIALGLTIVSVAPLSAQNLGDLLVPESDAEISRVGTRGANFLGIGVGARAMGMGGIGTTLGGGLSALYWNTASIVDVETVAIGVSSADLYGNSGLSHTFGGLVAAVGDGAVGLSVSYFTSGEVERTTEEYPDGNDPSFGAVVEWNAVSLGLHYSLRVTDRLAVGAAGKYIEEGIDLAKAKYLGFDVGAFFDIGIYGLTLGAAITNFGTEGRFEGGLVTAVVPEDREVFPSAGDRAVRYDTQKMQLPTALRFSVRSSLLGPPEAVITPNAQHGLDLHAQIFDGIDTNVQFALGLEYGFRQIFFLRGGKSWVNENQSPRDFGDGLSAGIGIRIPLFDRDITFDYAYATVGDLDNAQHFSLDFGF
jgi:hypothetical protein